MSKVLGAAIAALVSASAAPAPVMPDVDAIAIMYCEGNSGTAFWISPTRIISVEHVSDNGSCTIDGQPVHVVRTEAGDDFVELAGVRNEHFLTVSCERPRRWERYTGWGYAHGRIFHRAWLIGTGQRVRRGDDIPEARRMGRFIGTGYPGMSGGPIANLKGEVIGTVNRGGGEPAFLSSRLLRDTFVCEDEA